MTLGEGAAPPAEHGRRRMVLRVLVVWLATALTLLLVSEVFHWIEADTLASALSAAALIGIINALVWPIVLRFALPFTVLTLGLGVVLVNGAVVLLVGVLEPTLHVESLLAGIATALAITVITTIVLSLFALDDESVWFRNVVARQARRAAPAANLEVPGLFCLEIDGLAHDVLMRAIRDGNAPNMARWMHQGSHRLQRWETDWSSQTGACQAGILHGSNHDMPAFRWWEKDRGAAMVTNHPRDAMEIERRHSNGRGLLYADGSSRANIVSGDAPHTLLTMSTVLRRDRKGRIGQDYFAYFANPYTVIRTIVMVVREIFSELWHASRQRRLDVQPRIHRGFSYALVRAWATIIQRDLQVSSIIADLYAGRPVAYTTFLAYDEVAHHSGIERVDTLTVLRQVDHQIGRIAAAAVHAPREYHLVVLSDHGQSQGATFLQRYGETLEDLVKRTVSADAVAGVGRHTDEALGFLGASLAEAGSGGGTASGIVRRASKGRSVDGEVMLGSEAREAEETRELEKGAEEEAPPEVVVMASGCLGLIAFPREPGRVTLEQIESLHPGLIDTLVNHPGIGFLLVRSSEHGPIAIGANGRCLLADGRVEGEDPLAPFGPRARSHVLRTDGFPHCADIMVNSTFWSDTDEVAAFEELVGSHGGMGGEQSFPFLLYPVSLPGPEAEPVGAEAIHHILRGWLAHLGHAEYADGDASSAGDAAAGEPQPAQG